LTIRPQPQAHGLANGIESTLSGAVQNTATATAADTLGNILTQNDKVTVTATISVTKP
jgi:hypothetical protein